MKSPRLLATTLATTLALALPTPLVLAEESKPAEKPATEAESTPLEDKMGRMGAAWRKLRRQVSDPAQNAASLELVATIRKASEGAEKLAPAKLAEIPEADREKFLADYEAGIKKLHAHLELLEAALKAGNNEDAGKAFSGIADHMREAHDAFKKEEPKKK